MQGFSQEAVQSIEYFFLEDEINSFLFFYHNVSLPFLTGAQTKTKIWLFIYFCVKSVPL